MEVLFMSISGNFQDKLKGFSKYAKDTFDYAKMEIKIKSYNRECKKRYTRIGILVYDSKKKGSAVNGEEIERICKEIDIYKHRIKVLEKQIDDIKSAAADDINSEDIVDSPDKDNNDKMSYDGNIIKFFKFCPKCNVGNEPDTKVCVKCGYEFEK